MTGYRSRSTKPTALMWMLVAAADAALLITTVSTVVLAAIAGLATVALAGVGARTVLVGRPRTGREAVVQHRSGVRPV